MISLQRVSSVCHKNKVKSFCFYLFLMSYLRKRFLSVLSYENREYRFLAYFDRKWCPSVMEHSEGPMDTVSSNKQLSNSENNHLQFKKEGC